MSLKPSQLEYLEKFKPSLAKQLKDLALKIKSFKIPLTLTSSAVLQRRYLKKNDKNQPIETPEDMFWRVAVNVASADLLYDEKADISKKAVDFYHLMASFDFLPNSPTLMNAGRQLQQLSACFVLPVEDSMDSIFEAVKQTAIIHKTGGGTGFSFNHLRPKNDVVSSTRGMASGPISFMKVFNSATDVIKQGGVRRGANMGILNVDHPDILEFINAKRDPEQLTNFNLSVGVTEEFMDKARKGEDYPLINPHNKKPAGKLNAKEVFDLIVKTAWETGEPGIIFIDRLNKSNPTPNIGQIESTNPCGEVPLLPYESCNLGSVNLSKMLKKKNEKWETDYNKLEKTIRLAVRFLDNVVDVSRYPLEEIAAVTKSNRKIGLGVMGFADMLLLLEIPYNSKEALEKAESLIKFIQTTAKDESAQIAKERGVFPNFKGSIYDKKGGLKLRNATLTTIAPTGSLSIIAGCSSGIEPLFALCFVRQILSGDRFIEINPYFEIILKDAGIYSPQLIDKVAQTCSVQDIREIPDKTKKIFATTFDIAPVWHIKMQAAFQKYTDNAVSKTVNFPESASPKDVEEVFWLAYNENCKGVTIYRYGSRKNQVLSRKGAENNSDLHNGQ